MFLEEYLKKFKDNKIKIFVDMDGVIVDYDFGKPCEYDIKRPLYTSIKKLEEISKMNNVELFIFSATRMSEGIKQKNAWLDQYANFFKTKNRIIISREENDFIPSANLKAEYLKEYKREENTKLIVIDDDPRNLKEINKLNEDIILLKDTALID